jgi:hypothetical protein
MADSDRRTNERGAHHLWWHFVRAATDIDTFLGEDRWPLDRTAEGLQESAQEDVAALAGEYAVLVPARLVHSRHRSDGTPAARV